MSRRIPLTVALYVAAFAAGCGAPRDIGPDSDASASISLALTSVPTDVQCVEIDVQGTRTVSKRAPVASGQASTITVDRLPAGDATVDVLAFAADCAGLPASAAPTWAAVNPATVTLVTGQTASVTIALKRVAGLAVTADFQDDQPPPPTIVINPAPIAFGPVGVGLSNSAFVNVINTGTTPATVTPALTGPDAGDFQIAANGICAGTVPLDPGTFCTMLIAFAPRSPGAKSATFTVGAPMLASSALSGTGTPSGPSLQVFPATLDSGQFVIGGSGSIGSISVFNNGTVSENDLTPSIIGPDAADFSVSFDNCSGAPLPPFGSCFVNITFVPTTVGRKTATLTFGDGSLATANLVGVVVSQQDSLLVSPPSIAFGSVAVGTSAESNALVLNSGNIAVNPSPVITGPDAADFAIGDGQCSFQIGQGQPCGLIITFTPSSPGPKSATIELGGTTPPIATTSLTGIGTAAAP